MKVTIHPVNANQTVTLVGIVGHGEHVTWTVDVGLIVTVAAPELERLCKNFIHCTIVAYDETSSVVSGAATQQHLLLV